MEVKLEARAKINLMLDVLGKRADGYHELSTVMQSITLADTLVFRSAGPGIVLRTSHPRLPVDKGNLVYRAAEALAEMHEPLTGVEIWLDKRIPVAAGLGGGSADAAATLLGLNTLWNLGLTMAELRQVAGTLGSDIPFCLSGGTALATGRGEIIRPLPALPPYWVVLVTPPFGVSTAEVYRQLQLTADTAHPQTEGVVRAIRQGDLSGLIPQMVNVLETVTEKVHPEIRVIKAGLQAMGAAVSLMSGSGPTVFGLFTAREKAAAACRQARKYAGTVHLAQLAAAGVSPR